GEGPSRRGRHRHQTTFRRAAADPGVGPGAVRRPGTVTKRCFVGWVARPERSEALARCQAHALRCAQGVPPDAAQAPSPNGVLRPPEETPGGLVSSATELPGTPVRDSTRIISLPSRYMAPAAVGYNAPVHRRAGTAGHC